MSDMDNCKSTKDEFMKDVECIMKDVKRIKQQAICAIEKREKVIEEKEKEIEELQEELEKTKGLLEEIKNETKNINNIKEEQKETIKLLKELIDLFKNKNNEELKKLQEKLNDKRIRLGKLEREKEENAKKVGELNTEIAELNDHLKQEQEKCRQSETEKERVTDELNKLKEDMHYELYEQYCALSEDFRERCTSIDFSDLYCFVKTSSQDGILRTLHDFIKDDTRSKNPEVGSLMNFFDALFEVQAKKGKFERFDVKIDDEYTDREMIKIGDGPAQGKVKKVIFRGYRRVGGNEIGKSLVEVK